MVGSYQQQCPQDLMLLSPSGTKGAEFASQMALSFPPPAPPLLEPPAQKPLEAKGANVQSWNPSFQDAQPQTERGSDCLEAKMGDWIGQYNQLLKWISFILPSGSPRAWQVGNAVIYFNDRLKDPWVPLRKDNGRCILISPCSTRI